ncbi:MAG: BrnA antitoxin family protein [Amaricoccus sp.]
MADRRQDPHDDGRSLREEIAYAQLVAELALMKAWWNRARLKPGVVPRDAAGIAVAGPRTNVTLKLDADVAKWFRAMGLGYQARMNYALKSWMLAVIERELEAGAAGGR